MTISIRSALLLAFGALVLAITLVLLGASIVQRDRLVRDLAPQILGGAQRHADADLRRLFGLINDRLETRHRQVELGLLPRFDTPRLKDAFLPDVYHLSAVGSMMLGDTTGYQLLLMRYDSLVTRSPLLAGQPDLPEPSRDPHQYFTREFRADAWGERSLWTLWDPAGMRVQQTWERPLPGYDPRRREWLVRAMERRAVVDSAGGSRDPAQYIAWTDVYTLFTSKTPGISASIAAREPSGHLVVVAYDLLLDDLSAFTRSQHPTKDGVVFVVSDSGLVVGLPANEAWSTAPARSEALLRPLEEVGGPALAAWTGRWRARTDEPGVPFRFRTGGENYWGSYQQFEPGPGRRLWIGVVVPERDLLATTRHDPLLILGLALLAMLVAFLAARAISGQMSAPLVALLGRSRRIGALEFDPDPAPPTVLREVRDLGATIEQTGEALRAHLDARDRARAALVESEARFRSTFEQSAVGMCHVSVEGRFLRVNQRMCDMFGRSRDELLAIGFADVTHPDHLPTDRRRIREMLEGGTDVGSWEKRYVHASGEVLWGQITTRLLRDDRGAPRYFISVVQDISERRSLEAQLLQAQKLEAVGQLAGGVAHDFNNLLTVIKGHAMLARTTVTPDHPALHHLEEVEYAAQRAVDLTRQLLAFARRDVVAPRVVDVGVQVQRSQRMLKRLIDERIELEVVPGPRPFRVRIDEGQLDQVLVNLVVNARDAMPSGGRIHLSVSEVEVGDEDSRLHPGSSPGPHVEIRVADTGAGMTPEVRAHLFEPFFTTKPPGEGTGLGLSTCYGIVQRAGGHIAVESAPGEGSTFFVRLPSVTEAAGADFVPRVGDPVPEGRETVLIAEDESAIRAINERVLRQQGYTVHSAADGLAALALGERLGASLDVLVTDAIMPGLSGRDLAARLRAGHAGLKVLFVSGYAPESMRGDLPEGLHFLAKPYGPDTLARRVRAVLDSAG